MGFILLVGFPDDGKTYKGFLTHEETALIIRKVDADRGDAVAPKFSIREYLTSAKDPKIWLFAMLFFNTTTITYALAYFMPAILKTGLHFNTMESQGLIAPPYVFAGFNMWLTGYIGDKYHIRGPIIIYNMLLCIIGLPIIGWAHNNNLRYFAIFLVTAGANANVPTVMTYQANNIRGHWKRAFCSATLVGFGGIGGIAGSLVFRKKDEPHWYPGMMACLTCAGLNVLIVVVLTLHFKRANAKADRGEIVIEGSEVSLRFQFS
jgi:MFS family permease